MFLRVLTVSVGCAGVAGSAAGNHSRAAALDLVNTSSTPFVYYYNIKMAAAVNHKSNAAAISDGKNNKSAAAGAGGSGGGGGGGGKTAEDHPWQCGTCGTINPGFVARCITCEAWNPDETARAKIVSAAVATPPKPQPKPTGAATASAPHAGMKTAEPAPSIPLNAFAVAAARSGAWECEVCEVQNPVRGTLTRHFSLRVCCF